MDRIEKLHEYVNETLWEISDPLLRAYGWIHLYGVAQNAALLATKRGLDAELATMAGLLHDIATYKTGDPTGHAHRGADMARELLTALNLCSGQELDILCSAIRNHSDKRNTAAPFDEVLKDADVLQHYLYNVTIPIPPNEYPRVKRACTELGIPL